MFKKWLRYKCFPMDFAKNLITFFTERLWTTDFNTTMTSINWHLPSVFVDSWDIQHFIALNISFTNKKVS